MAKVEQVSPNAANYMRGGSRVKIQRKADAGSALPWLDFGNIKTITLTPTKEESTHITGRTGKRVEDRKRVDILSIAYEIEIDEYTLGNLRTFLQGDAIASVNQAGQTGATKTVTALTGQADEDDILIGMYYKLGKLKVANVVHVSLIEGTDFIVDYEMGQIAFLKTPSNASLIQNFTYNVTELIGKTFNQFAFATLDVVAEGMDALEQGNILDVWTVPQATIAPSGGGTIDIAADTTLKFTLTQTYHLLSKWGTRTRHELSS